MITMVKRTRIIKVDQDFRRMIEKFSKKNKITMVQASKEIANAFNLMNGKKKMKKRIIEEVNF